MPSNIFENYRGPSNLNLSDSLGLGTLTELKEENDSISISKKTFSGRPSDGETPLDYK